MKPGGYRPLIALFLSGLLIAAAPLRTDGPYAAKSPGKADLETLQNLEYNSAFFERKRDPILAGILSWYVPGLGQFYSGKIWKGTAFLVTEYALTLGAVFYFMNFDFSAGGKTGFKVNVDAKRTDLGVVETSRRNVFYGMMSLVAVIHLYNISDAVQSARGFNGELEIERRRLHRAYPFIYSGGEEKRSLYLGMQSHF
jgi:TM2 domain-containing membrane protein YozV